MPLILPKPEPQISVEELKQRLDLVALVEQAGVELRRIGKRHVGPCPKHGGVSRASFSVNADEQLWYCFGCAEGGDAIRFVEWLQGVSFRDALTQLAGAQGVAIAPGTKPEKPAPRVTYTPPPPPRPELIDALLGYQDALPGSAGEAYLTARGITIEQAQRFGLGYAAPGRWIGRSDYPRIVAPHTDPAGELINLYGRLTVELPDALQKAYKHDHLSGKAGLFNAHALAQGDGPVWLCEAVFDALALNAAGVERVCAVFGVKDWRWDWAKGVREIVLALDGDGPGQLAAKHLAQAARLRGKLVAILPADVYGGEKDANAALVAGRLELGDWATLTTLDDEASDTPTKPYMPTDGLTRPEVGPAPIYPAFSGDGSPADRADGFSNMNRHIAKPTPPSADDDPFVELGRLIESAEVLLADDDPWQMTDDDDPNDPYWIAQREREARPAPAAARPRPTGDAPIADVEEIELHPDVTMAGSWLIVRRLDDRRRHRLLGAIAGARDKALAIVETRHDYKQRTLKLSHADPELRPELAILITKTLYTLDAEAQQSD